MKVFRCKEIIDEEILWLSEKNRLKLFEQQIRIMEDDGINKPQLKDLSPLVYWCNENCNSIYYRKENCFFFLDETDLAAFKLRWSE